jgi:hypothetical protein
MSDLSEKEAIINLFCNSSFEQRVAFLRWFLRQFAVSHARLMCGMVRDKRKCPHGHEVNKEEEIVWDCQYR